MWTRHTQFVGLSGLEAYPLPGHAVPVVSANEEAMTNTISFKPFFIHHPMAHNNGAIPDSLKFRGFSAFIEPSGEGHDVLVYVVRCHPADEFNKAQARAYLAKAVPEIMNAREVDHFLAGVKASIFKREMGVRPYAPEFSWVFKYMV